MTLAAASATHPTPNQLPSRQVRRRVERSLSAQLAALSASDSERFPAAPSSAGLGHDTKSATPPPAGHGRAGAQQARRARYDLRDSLNISSPYERMRKCGRCRIDEAVTAVRRADGSVSLAGLARCGSVWACPVCAPAMLAERGEELGRLGTWALAEGYHVAMLSLTVRHAWSDSIDDTLEGVARSYSRLCSGAPWERFCERVGLVGSVRAMELTHAWANGWHPHIHALVIVRDEVPLPEGVHGPRVSGIDALFGAGWDWLAERWSTVVTRQLGDPHTPTLEHGCVLTVAEHCDYIAKMGLDMREVSGSTEKHAAEGHRTPWEIGRDAAKGGDASDWMLWRSYERATHGRRQLVWSRGLRALCGAEEQTERALLERAEERGEGIEVARLGASDWAWVLARRAVCELLDAAESGDPARLVRVLTGRAPDD